MIVAFPIVAATTCIISVIAKLQGLQEDILDQTPNLTSHSNHEAQKPKNVR